MSTANQSQAPTSKAPTGPGAGSAPKSKKRRRRPRRQTTRAVVTGAAGRLGQLLIRRLHRIEGVEVLAIDRRTFHRKPADVEHIKVDIRRNRSEEIFRSRRIDVIFHLGLMHDLRRKSDEHHRWNLLGSQRVFEYAERYRVPKVVLLSSGDVYGPEADNPTFISEDAPLNGARRFAAIRDLVSVDMLAQSYFWKTPEIETVVLRPAHILGGVGNALSRYLRMARIPVLLGYDPMVQVLHEEDVTSAIVAASTPGLRGVFNVTGPTALPLRKLLGLTGRPVFEMPHLLAPALARMLYRARVIEMPADELDYMRYPVTLDSHRAQRLLKFRARYSVRDAVDAALRRQVFDGGVELASHPG